MVADGLQDVVFTLRDRQVFWISHYWYGLAAPYLSAHSRAITERAAHAVEPAPQPPLVARHELGQARLASGEDNEGVPYCFQDI
ncbi:hypothetical protein BKM31_58690 [[Actinomadura] parvosata subsp. kistnae]|uniref:Uncharacterized protein n=1 Tax=[Actinomadura] parvosata subsp. kistnae TaxID=1909395 RepID=A0A1V0AIH7_9ACTN|nr:hypothetical protein BKM31_58690 [Nonomuraea sp. ATCC 55076]